MKSFMEMANNKEFMEKMAAVKNADELKALFTAEGLSLENGLSYDQAYAALHHAMCDELSDEEKAEIESMDSELSEDELENVAGGFWWGGVIAIGVLLYFGYKYVKGVRRAWNECG